MTTEFYAILAGLCLIIVILESIVVMWSCNRAEVLARTVAQQNERIDALVGDTHARLMEMPVLDCTDLYVDRKNSLN